MLKREKEAKVAALSEKERLRRDAGIAKRAEIRTKRLAQEAADREARQKSVKAERERAAAAEKLKMQTQQLEASKQLLVGSLQATARGKGGQQTRGVPDVKKKTSLDVMPTLDQLRADVIAHAPMPTMNTLSCALQTSIVYADSDRGISAWGDGAGAWAHPSGWLALVERFNSIYKNPGSEPDWCDDVLNGEYNAVFVGKRDWHQHVSYLPPLVDQRGEKLTLGDVVFRVTRPDSEQMQGGGGRFHRYKRLENLTREIYYTLYGAANGFAPECYAVVLFPAIVVKTKAGPVQLYGSLYVMRRAQIDLGNLLDDHVDETQNRIHPSSMEYIDSLRKSGRRVAIKMLPVLFRQSRLGLLSFDSKPGNYVFGVDSKPYAVDFDSAMSYMLGDGDGDAQRGQKWEPNLLVNLTLLTAHVRCYRHPALADGWASAVRELIIELCTHSRGEQWIYQARADANRKFTEMMVKDAATQRKCLEMVAGAYFIKPRGHAVTTFKAIGGKAAPPLMHQLVRFCLHGSIKRADGAVDRALGASNGR